MSLPRLADNTILADTDWSLKQEVVLTFDNSSLGSTTLFTVNGAVLMRLLAVCTTNLAGASATIEVGYAASTAKLIAQTTATNLAENEIWHDNSPDSKVELSSVLAENIVTDDVIITVGTASVTSGEIKFTAMWYPLTDNATVTAVSGGQVTAVSPSVSSSLSASTSTSDSSSSSTSASGSKSASLSSSESASSSSSQSPSSTASPSSSTSSSISSSASPSSSTSSSISSSASPSSSESKSSSLSESASISLSTSLSASSSASPSEEPVQ